jgi:hypothetical protein
MEESVVAVEWSVADPWIYAGLSYNGTVMIGNVPDRVKY